MTLKELHSEVKALGFDDFLYFDARFLSAVSCALKGIYNAVSISAKTKFFVKSSLPSSKISLFHHKGGEVDSLTLKGKAYAMRLYGAGKYILTEGSTSVTTDFNCNGDVFKGFLNSDATLMLVGNESFTVCDLVTFDEVFSGNAGDIPDGSGYSTVDIGRIVADFLCFSSMPKDLSGEVIETAVLHDDKITFDPDFSGEVELSYRKSPILPSLDAPDVRIDLPSEYSLLLPLLTASYILLDSDSDKALYYKQLYESELASIKALKRNISANRYTIADGWA